jgi:hypothetical protein
LSFLAETDKFVEQLKGTIDGVEILVWQAAFGALGLLQNVKGISDVRRWDRFLKRKLKCDPENVGPEH